MKSFFLLLVLSTLMTNLTLAQRVIATSEDDIEYITKRLVRDIKEHYDFKPGTGYERTGYKKKLPWRNEGGWREVELVKYKVGENVAAYLLWLTDSWGNFDLRVIPTKYSIDDIKRICREALDADASEWKTMYLSLLLDVARDHLLEN